MISDLFPYLTFSSHNLQSGMEISFLPFASVSEFSNKLKIKASKLSSLSEETPEQSTENM